MSINEIKLKSFTQLVTWEAIKSVFQVNVRVWPIIEENAKKNSKKKGFGWYCIDNIGEVFELCLI